MNSIIRTAYVVPQQSNENRHFRAIFNRVYIHSFNITPYQWQSDVGTTILSSYYCLSPIKYLLVRPTGGGGNLVFDAIALIIEGVTLCIYPLLSLGDDQCRKVMETSANDEKHMLISPRRN